MATRFTNSDSNDDSDAFGDIASEYTARLAEGEVPSVDDYSARHPGFAEKIRSVFPALRALGEVARSGVKSNTKPTTFQELHPGDRLGDFTIIRELGRGGMGIVYEASQVSMGRRVAVKILPLSPPLPSSQSSVSQSSVSQSSVSQSSVSQSSVSQSSGPHIERFQTEVMATAKLSHPNIVPVFSAGEQNGIRYYAMQLVRGVSLADLVHGLREAAIESDRKLTESSIESQWEQRVEQHGAARLSDNDRQESHLTTPPMQFRCSASYFDCMARLMIGVADGLDHAHEHGILHRDIKPANLLLNDLGEVCITDFGVATIDAAINPTGKSEIGGTLRYMPPEQTLARSVADRRTDIYALGATFYELLTLCPAFRGSSRQEIARHIIWGKATSPRLLNPSIPRDLEAIVLKCMAREPSDRYQSADEVREELANFLARRPVKARGTGLHVRMQKTFLRHPAALAAGALLGVILIACGVWVAREFGNARRRAQEVQYAADIRLAYQAVKKHDFGLAARLLEKHDARKLGESRNDFAWNYLYQSVQCDAETVSTAKWGTVTCLAVGRLGRYSASAHASQSVVLWNQMKLKPLAVIPDFPAPIQQMQFSTDESKLILADANGRVEVWDLELKQPIVSHPRSQGTITAIVTLPNASQAILVRGQSLEVWDWTSANTSMEWAAHTEPISAVACSSDGLKIATVDRSGLLRVWNRDTREILKELVLADGPRESIESVVWHPNGRELMLTTGDGQLLRLDMEQGEQPTRQRVSSHALTAQMHRSNKVLQLLDQDMSIFSLTLDAELSPVRRFQHWRSGNESKFLADGRVLTSGAGDVLRIWPQGRWMLFASHAQAEATHSSNSVSNDGNWCAHVSRESLPSVVRRGDNHLQRLPFLGSNLRACYTHDSKRLLLTANRITSPNDSLPQETDSPLELDLDGDGDLDRMAAFGASGACIQQEQTRNGQWSQPHLGEAATKVDRATFFNSSHDPQLPVCWQLRSKSPQLQFVRYDGEQFDENVPGRPCSLATADLDGDGRLDLILATQEDGAIRWYSDAENDRLHVSRDVVVGWGDPHALLAADVDGDGMIDLAASGSNGLCWWRNQGAGKFAAGTIVDPTAREDSRLAWIDFDGDTVQDIVCATPDRLLGYRRRSADGTFDTPRPIEDMTQLKGLMRPTGKAVVWNLETQSVEHQFDLGCNYIEAAALSQDDQLLATADGDGRIRIRRVASGAPIRTLPREFSPVQGLTWSRDGRQLLISSGPKVFVWDLHRNRQQFVWDAHERQVNKVVVSPSQALAATVGQDFRVNLWSLETGKRLKAMQGHQESPVSAAFGELGRILVTLGERGEMLFWHVGTGEELFAIRESAITNADDILMTGPFELIRLGHFADRLQTLALRTDRKLPWQHKLDAMRTTSEEPHEPARWR